MKNQGDGFMLVFPDPPEALRCAVEIQRDLAERAAEQPRSGSGCGWACTPARRSREEGDFFGRSVILAARIAAQASGGEILVSEELREHADGEDRLDFDDGRELELKGMAGRHLIYTVGWREQPARLGQPGAAPLSRQARAL